MEREDYIKQINDLRLAKADTHAEPISVDDVKRSDLFTETATNLAKVEAHCAQLQKAFDDVNQRWAKTKGDLDLAQKAIKEMEESHVKRLEEISTTGIVADKDDDADAASDTSDANGDSVEKAYISDAKKIAALEHKLAQALENVRQAETVRESLAEANRINETISAKLDEYQAKNSALIQAKAAARAAEIAGTASADAKGEDDNVVQKLKAEHRKMRKELQAALQSKDNARAKQEVSYGIFSSLLFLLILMLLCTAPSLVERHLYEDTHVSFISLLPLPSSFAARREGSRQLDENERSIAGSKRGEGRNEREVLVDYPSSKSDE